MIFLRNTNRQIVRSAYRISIIRPERELHFIAEVLTLFSVVIIALSAHARESEDMIVFVSELTHELFLTDGLQGEPVQLTENMNVSWPSLSPDGEEVVFVSEVGGLGSSIRKINIATHRIEQLAGGGQNVRYSELDCSPDGRRIVFVMERTDEPIVSILETNICVVDLQTLEFRQLTDSPAGKRCPSWSRDSNRILYVETDPIEHESNLSIIDKFGHHITTIETTDILEWLSAWRPSGRQISSLGLIQLREKSSQQLYIMDLLENRIFALTSGGDAKRPLDWSPDGERILFSMQQDIYVIDSSGQNMANLTETPTEYERDGCWSPGAESIVFSGTTPNSKSAIFIVDSDGQNRRQLTFGDSNDLSPAWSPDGSKIAFRSDRDSEDRAYRIYIMDPDGKNIKQITHHQREADRSLAWSPDGQSIAFVSGSTNHLGIYLIDAQGRNERLIIQSSKVYEDCPAWSPDGDYLVYTSYTRVPPMLFELISIPIDGGEATKLSTDELNGWRYPVWSPDGRNLLFGAFPLPDQTLLEAPPDFHVMTMNMDGSGLREFQPAIPLKYTGGWAWSPDGSQVLLSKGIYSGIAITPDDRRSIHLIDPVMGTMTLWMADAAYPDWIRPGYLYSVNPVSKLLTTWGRVKNVSTSVK